MTGRAISTASTADLRRATEARVYTFEQENIAGIATTRPRGPEAEYVRVGEVKVRVMRATSCKTGAEQEPFPVSSGTYAVQDTKITGAKQADFQPEITVETHAIQLREPDGVIYSDLSA